MEDNEHIARRFLDTVAENYDYCMKRWRKHQKDNNTSFDEDLFQETILKVYDKILKDGLKDITKGGMLNYFFKSFIINSKREYQYSRNLARER